MPQPAKYEESQGESHTELDQFLGEQLKSKEQEDETKKAIEGAEIAENTLKNFKEELHTITGNAKESPEYRKLL